MASWTRLVLRRRVLVVCTWLVVLGVGVAAYMRLGPLLANSFAVPGTDSERAKLVLQHRFHDRPDGDFTVVFRVRDASDPALRVRLQRIVDRAAKAVPTGRPTPLRPGGRHVLYGDVISTLQLAKAKGYTKSLLRAIGQPAGTNAYVTGAAAIQSELDPIFGSDLARGEAIALPIALAVLFAVFGLSWAVTIPFLFAGCTIMGTLGLVYLAAHELTTATYVTNLVQLVGLGISIDYSLLIVYRFREELERASPPPAPEEREVRGGEVEDAIVRTMQTAGRAVIFSGAAVAIGLALLLAIPIPFIRSIGIGGFLIPLVSIAAAATLQPALLSLYGRRGAHRVAVAARLRRLGVPLPRFAGTTDPQRGMWARIARSIMRRPYAYLAAGAAVLVTVAIPVYALQLTPGSVAGIPRFPQAVRGFDVLTRAAGPGAMSPVQLVVDAGPGGNIVAPGTQLAVRRLISEVRADREVVDVVYRPGRLFVDPTRRYAHLLVAGRHEYGTEQEQGFVGRLRSKLVPAAGLPVGVRVFAGGAPAQGVDFLSRSYSIFPWLVVGVLVLTYLLLMRLFRSLLLPLKAVLLNVLSVATAYGALVLVFRFGVGTAWGLYQYPQIEGWIPIFLFAMLFGLSMDYEVFLVTRMREAWDAGRDNVHAVAEGLERTGRIVTAAAIIMVAAFSGFIAGRVLGLQEFGIGLAVAVFVDATIVRAILVPALMAIFGRWNWWLPRRAARIVRADPSPLAEPGG